MNKIHADIINERIGLFLDNGMIIKYNPVEYIMDDLFDGGYEEFEDDIKDKVKHVLTEFFLSPNWTSGLQIIDIITGLGYYDENR